MKTPLAALSLFMASCGGPAFSPGTGDAALDAPADGTTADTSPDATAADVVSEILGPACPITQCRDLCYRSPAPVCCVYTPSMGAGIVCSASDNCGDIGSVSPAELHCSDHAGCPKVGDVCCITKAAGHVSSICTNVASCTGPSAVLCDLNAVPDSCLPSACSLSNIHSWGLPPCYGTCGGQSAP